MRFIPTRIHGMVDYSMGLILIVAPWLFAFAQGGWCDHAGRLIPARSRKVVQL